MLLWHPKLSLSFAHAERKHADECKTSGHLSLPLSLALGDRLVVFQSLENFRGVSIV